MGGGNFDEFSMSLFTFKGGLFSLGDVRLEKSVTQSLIA